MRALIFCLFALGASYTVAEELSPYAGEQHRSLKSLSEAEVRALRNGEGMGFARLAELNSYPGPRHVLDLAEELDLSGDQLEKTQALFAEMHRSAVATGEDIIEAERLLNLQFAAQDIEPDALQVALTQIGLLRAQLRHVHLDAHLRQRDLLSTEQIETYNRLRGYGNDDHTSGEPDYHNGHH